MNHIKTIGLTRASIQNIHPSQDFHFRLVIRAFSDLTADPFQQRRRFPKLKHKDLQKLFEPTLLKSKVLTGESKTEN